MRVVRQVLLNQASPNQRTVYFQLTKSDGTPALAEAGGQPQISVNSGAWTNTGIGVLVAIGNGRYSAPLTQAAVNGSAGDWIETRYSSGNTVECSGDSVQVDSLDPARSILDPSGLDLVIVEPKGVTLNARQ